MRALDGVSFLNFTTLQGPFVLSGGSYYVSIFGTSGAVQLKMLCADGNYKIAHDRSGTDIKNTALGTAYFMPVDLPPGTYEFDVSSAVGAYASIQRIPGE
jgi:hypothetical protein